ncbi:DUF3311 domain-containing protein [Aureliella helgolandensis]|uniref:DUF3311 domain-containing protein n=1 Tax=Aureliella helgolandensis TaxID=2527968 RepID=A0A518G762_9BACT|nr:DUF3311 domain-containing protein [Aureliella helgolandensis]QDV24425.1 hypothetical protein Q31a_27430 [Aureliella helgolandensis]
MRKNSSGMMVISGLVVLLLVLHQDNWLWDDDSLVFGFMPIGLFYHVCLSMAAAATWFLATLIAWPEELAAEDYHVSPPRTASPPKASQTAADSKHDQGAAQ